MAEKRMFARSVVDCDDFLDLSVSVQLLYFHLGMQADDDGFVGSPKKVCRSVGCGEDELQKLAESGFIIRFDSGVVVIRHWFVNNYIPNDRKHKTIHNIERSKLKIEENRTYSLMDTGCIQNVNKLDTEISIEKTSIAEHKQEKEADAICIQNVDGLYTDQEDGSFQELWNEYPKKTAEREAREQYEHNLDSGISHSQMEHAVKAYLRENEGTETRYVKKLCVFLSDESLIKHYAKMYEEKFRAADEIIDCYL